MIYTTGTISVNGNTLTGAGTNFTAAGSLIRIGCTVLAMTSPPQAFQITGITSGTVMTVSPAASPALAAGTKYSILLSDSLSVDGLAQDIAETFGMYQRNISGFADVMNGTGDVTITVDGKSVTVPGQKSLAKKGANSDITSLNGLKTALSVAQGGTGKTTEEDARKALSAAKSGKNSDITELAGLTTALSIAQGGTGATDAAGIRKNAGLGTAATKDVTTSSADVESGRLMKIADFGLGGSPITSQNLATISPDDADNATRAGFFAGSGETTASKNYRLPYAPMFVGCRRGGSDGTGTVSQIQSTNSNFAFRYREQGVWSPWRDVYHTANTTKASDGTLKAASPVVKLFHDGRYETNEESEGCIVQRIDAGQYLVTGCIGLNSDAAWGGISGGFDIPKDRNGQELIWLDFEVNQDGSVLVKTYHRTYLNAPAFAQNIIDGLTEGEPVDIPADQFVSVRVEMPADSIWNQKQTVIQAETDREE